MNQRFFIIVGGLKTKHLIDHQKLTTTIRPCASYHGTSHSSAKVEQQFGYAEQSAYGPCHRTGARTGVGWQPPELLRLVADLPWLGWVIMGSYG